MNPPPTPPANDPLESTIRRAVAGLPLRPAPATLESRVLAAIAAMESQPWWRRGLPAWPAPARWLGLPLLGGIAAAVLLVLGGGAAAEILPRPELPAFMATAWDVCRAVSQALAGVVAMLTRSVPVSWWYAALFAFAVWYAGVVGLGLTAYRLLRTRD